MNGKVAARPPKFAVIHPGAALHYALPAVLEQAGLLQSLYTDAHADSVGLRWLRWLPATFRPLALRRLFARRLPAVIPRAKVHAWLWPTLQSEWFNRTAGESSKNAPLVHRRKLGGHWLAHKAMERNFDGANALYVRPCVSTDAIHEANRRGIPVVLETTSHPLNVAVQQAEYKKLGLAPSLAMQSLEANVEFFRKEAQASDLVLAASNYVKRGLLELGVREERVAVVPYGLDAKFYDQPAEPVPGRVLFVGMIDPHKGLEYLAGAARQLRAEGFKGEFRAVGPLVCPKVMQHPAFAGLDYTGPVTRDDVKREFAAADVFVFPTLTDGFGMVLLEALFAGLPIICTPNCGDVVRDGFNGRVVPTHNAAALASAIRDITGDRTRRAEMSRNALSLTGEFTWEAYQRKLVAALSGVRVTGIAV